MISVVITSFDEGEEVKNTIDSVFKNTSSDVEVVLVDDASTDGSCLPLADMPNVTLVRHEERVGIAYSRNDGVAHARGDVYAFLDAHQRLSEGAFDRCAKLAVECQAIVWPCATGFGKDEGQKDSNWMGHGARMRQKTNARKVGLFEGAWIKRPPIDKVSRCSTMIVPGYVIPKSVWPKVKLIEGLRNHGCSEAALTVKAFFADVPVLHLCKCVTKHRFTPGHRLPFECPWWVVARNHALVARVCFTEKTWDEYWFPKVFKKHLRRHEGLIEEFYSEPITTWQKEFEAIKQRPDDEFWRGLIQQERVNG